MNPFDYTDKQREAIESLHQDLLVHAGAGSGKTKVLVGRFYHLVTKEGRDPRRILTITFTEKAAQEMKDRLRKLFLETRAKEIARQVNHAYISTIHAFCARLLRENALEANLDPAFTVLEEYEAQRVQKECLREVLNRQAEAADKNLLDFLLSLSSSDLEPDLLKLYRQAGGKGNVEFIFSPAAYSTEEQSSVVSSIFQALDKTYQAHKDRQGRLDFADLELKAKKLLVDHTDLRKELQGKWPHILLDELQDTNPLQLSIINLLRTPGQFFAVGDPHQSIYGFRFADLKAYQDLKREIDKQGKILTLEENFRSRRPLLELVDYCFDPLWPPGSLLSHIKMKEGLSFAAKEIPSVEAFVISVDKKEGNRQYEAEAVCRRIYRLVKEEKLPIYDKEQKITRPLAFGDCAILLRQTTHIKTWEQVLQNYGIPYQVGRSRGFFGAPEVVDFLNLLKLLENPLDNLALAAYLRSPLVGVSEDTLRLLAQTAKSNGKQSLYLTLQKKLTPIDPSEEEKLAFARELLERLRPLRPLGFYRLLKEALALSRYLAKSYLYPQGERLRANLHKLTQVVYDMSGMGMDHLRDLLEVADFLRYQKDEIAEGETASPDKNYLCLSTIHLAKGLEFPLVAVVELGHQKSRDREVFSLTGHNSLGIKTKEAEDTDGAPANAKEKKSKKKPEPKGPAVQERLDEELRLLYVALTRAKEHLLLSGSFRFNQDGGLRADQWINLVEEKVPLILPLKQAGEAGEEITQLGGVPVRLYWRDLSGETADLQEKSVWTIPELSLPEEENQNYGRGTACRAPTELIKAGEEHALTILDQVAKAQEPPDGSHYLVTVSEVVDFYRCPRLYQLKYLWGFKGDWEEEGIGEWSKDDGGGGEGSSRDLGIFVHGLLARPEWWEVGAQSRLGGMPLPIPEVLKSEEAKIRQMLENFARSSWKQAMEKARRVERELPFVVKLKDGLLRGQVDVLIFNDSSNYILLDYKTGKTSEEEKSYQLQLHLYALSLEKIYGIKPKKAVLYYLSDGGSYEVSLEKNELEAAEERAQQLFLAQRRQEFLHKTEYCSDCRQKKLCEQIIIRGN